MNLRSHTSENLVDKIQEINRLERDGIARRERERVKHLTRFGVNMDHNPPPVNVENEAQGNGQENVGALPRQAPRVTLAIGTFDELNPYGKKPVLGLHWLETTTLRSNLV